MSGKAFVDTNILLRAMMPLMPQHQDCEALIQKLWEQDIDLWISRQIIREYLVQATHPRTFSPPLPLAQVLKQMDQVVRLFRVAEETPQTTEQLFWLLQHYPTQGKQIHDSNIIAVMMVYQIDTLLTLNIDDLKRFEDRIKLITL